jgi:GntR family transcriptional regulator / MocR family aminotransferase
MEQPINKAKIMRIPLNRNSTIPLYRQIESYIRTAIIEGKLPPDTRLPATRKLARDLGINRITVENAYAELSVDGLIVSRTGSGTFVLAPPAHSPPPNADKTLWPLWQQEIRQRRPLNLQRQDPDQLLRAAGHPDPLNFAAGIGDPSLFPMDEFRKILQSVMRRDGIKALEYGPCEGNPDLRRVIAHVLSRQGVQTGPENILITAGSQQALTLVSQLLLAPGDTVVVEQPTYNGALDLFRALKLKVLGIRTDSRGMQVELLEPLLQQHHPRLIYTIPNFQNPSGACMNNPRRRLLISLADRYNVPLLEDDYVGDLRYEGRSLPALKALDPGGGVIYVSTFSKMLMPGLRVGCLVADGPLIEQLARFKRIHDLATTNLIQRALEAYVSVGRYQTHLNRVSRVYRKRRDAMQGAIDKYLPAGVHADPPQGGLFIWLRLPKGLSSTELLPLACEEGVCFAPGEDFFQTPEDGHPYLRLCFCVQPAELCVEGIRRLGNAMQRFGGLRAHVD